MKKNPLSMLILSLLLTGCSSLSFLSPTQISVEPLFVGPEKVICINPYHNNQCLQIKHSPEAQWELYIGSIVGLTYEPGYIYQLEVYKESNAKPAVGDPPVQWVLNRMISKTKSGEAVFSPASIQGIAWSMTQYGDPAGLTNARGEPKPAILFQADGKITGSTGCNMFTGTYSINNDRIQFGSLSPSNTKCATPDPVIQEQEQALLLILRQADHFVIEPTRLQIISSGNNRLIVFNK